MSWLKAFALVSLVACVENNEPLDETDLASEDAEPVTTTKADAPGWEPAATLHAGTSLHEFAGAGSRRVHSLWVAGNDDSRVALTLAATASGEDDDIRIAVLGPVDGSGTRPVLAADGYSSRKRAAIVSLDMATTGEHLVVVGSYGLLSETFYELSATCNDVSCEANQVDVLATPKAGALVGDGSRLISMQLGDVLAGYNGDVEVEVWASPPMQTWNAQHVATSYASGNQVNVIAPPAVRWGDDVRLVVREPSGRVFDTGVTTRFLPVPTNLVRLDAILYGDIASLQIGGSVGYFEGQADLRLRSVTHNREIAAYTAYADRPGMVGNGFNAFDATFLPDLSVAATDGELLSIGYINGNGDYRRLGCFEYCNNLSGLSSCTGGPRPCPAL